MIDTKTTLFALALVAVLALRNLAIYLLEENDVRGRVKHKEKETFGPLTDAYIAFQDFKKMRDEKKKQRTGHQN